ncbi:MAG: hypothetical protein R8K22_06405 [Mariprofundaceae bacterium]
MSLLQHYNTIRLVMATDEQAVTISELIGFKVDDEDRQALSDAKNYFSRTVSETKAKPCSDIDKIRSDISAKITRHQGPYSGTELESLADQFLSPSSGTYTAHGWQPEERATYHRATTLQKDYDLILSIAAQLMEAQQPYLCSHNWMEKQKNTYLEIAARHPQCSEATVRRRIQALKFSLNGWIFSATDLLCSNDLPLLCKHITRLLKTHQHAGRPTLYRLLHNEGYDFSDRNIGNAMKLLDMAKQHED